MKITLLDCGKWAIVDSNNHICMGGMLFDTYEQAQEFLFVYNTL